MKSKTTSKKATKKVYLWKFLRSHQGKIVSDWGINSKNGKTFWEVGKWNGVENEYEIECCHNGFHASENIYNAWGYVRGEVVAMVEVKGGYHVEDDKEAWEYMRIVKAWKISSTALLKLDELQEDYDVGYEDLDLWGVHKKMLAVIKSCKEIKKPAKKKASKKKK